MFRHLSVFIEPHIFKRLMVAWEGEAARTTTTTKCCHCRNWGKTGWDLHSVRHQNCAWKAVHVSVNRVPESDPAGGNPANKVARPYFIRPLFHNNKFIVIITMINFAWFFGFFVGFVVGHPLPTSRDPASRDYEGRFPFCRWSERPGGGTVRYRAITGTDWGMQVQLGVLKKQQRVEKEKLENACKNWRWCRTIVTTRNLDLTMILQFLFSIRWNFFQFFQYCSIFSNIS